MPRSSEACLTSSERRGFRCSAFAWLGLLLLTAGLLTSCAMARGGIGSQPSPQSAETATGAPEGSSQAAIEPSAAPPPATSTSTPTPTASATPTVPPTVTAVARTTPETIRAKIEVVWPHNGAAVRDADRANITAYLISETGNDAPPCDWEPTVRLWAAQNSQPAHPIAVGQKRMIATGGRRFPAWDFNDVDVSAAREAANKLTFFVTVDGVKTLHNVWVHAGDARTIFPQPDTPAGVVTRQPDAVDARIEVVWPHDGLPVDKATLANITGYLFESGTKQAIPSDLGWMPTVRLHHSNNAETETVQAEGTAPIGASRVITSENGVSFLAWDFDNVDVSSAQDSLNKTYFWLSVDDSQTFPNVWAHGANTPTIFPQTDILNSCK
jgi:hypothetical protein